MKTITEIEKDLRKLLHQFWDMGRDDSCSGYEDGAKESEIITLFRTTLELKYG